MASALCASSTPGQGRAGQGVMIAVGGEACSEVNECSVVVTQNKKTAHEVSGIFISRCRAPGREKQRSIVLVRERVEVCRCGYPSARVRRQRADKTHGRARRTSRSKESLTEPPKVFHVLQPMAGVSPTPLSRAAAAASRAAATLAKLQACMLPGGI
jgi:hypothetical protein